MHFKVYSGVVHSQDPPPLNYLTKYGQRFLNTKALKCSLQLLFLCPENPSEPIKCPTTSHFTALSVFFSFFKCWHIKQHCGAIEETNRANDVSPAEVFSKDHFDELYPVVKKRSKTCRFLSVSYLVTRSEKTMTLHVHLFFTGALM